MTFLLQHINSMLCHNGSRRAGEEDPETDNPGLLCHTAMKGSTTTDSTSQFCFKKLRIPSSTVLNPQTVKYLH